MTIDPDVQQIASGYASSESFTSLIQAVVNAEGNILRAVQCSLPSIQTRSDALKVVCRSAIHAMSDWTLSDQTREESFVTFWAARWAPVGAANDPTNLNKHWATNVERLWEPRTIPDSPKDEAKHA